MERFEWKLAKRKVKAARCDEHGTLIFDGICSECDAWYSHEQVIEAALEAYLDASESEEAN